MAGDYHASQDDPADGPILPLLSPHRIVGNHYASKIGSHAAQILPVPDVMEGKGAATVTVAPLNNAAAAQIICRFYLCGVCRFGTSCRFIHPDGGPSNDTTSITSSTSTSTTDRQQQPAKADPTANRKSTTSSVDLSRWIDAPVFVPASRLQYNPSTVKAIGFTGHQQDSAPAEEEDGEEEEEEDEDDEEEEEEEELVEVEDERDGEADNEEEEEEEEEEEDEDEKTGGEGEGGGAVGNASPDSPLSYANVVTMNNNHNGGKEAEEAVAAALADGTLCPFYEADGICPLYACPYPHGELCELCQKYCLHPQDREQQRRHNADCIKQHERDMEHAFAVQRSRDKSCGICLEVVMEKRAREQRFGILPNCKHTFCLSCIRTWRKATNFANKIKRGCPTCRVPSDFVCPSFVWVECGEEKERLIATYKQACNSTDCMHFKKGTATCPFGNKCFYRHALPSGDLVDVGAPSRRRNPLRCRARHRDLDHEDSIQLQEFFATLLAPQSWMLEEYMSLFSELDESDDDLYSGRGGGFPSDSSEDDDFLFHSVYM
uniref:RING-type E3 ubiquitin transferase n=1 Tax=Anopheles farauti TaxID=69004 RepID=A0A182PZD7_9DIPT